MSKAERRRRTALVVARRNRVKDWAKWTFPYEEVPNPWFSYRDWQIAEEWEVYRNRRLARYRGRCRKTHPLDCGKTHCPCCGGDKRWMSGKTRPELKNDLVFREQMCGEEEDLQN